MGFLVRDPLRVAFDFRLDRRLLGFGLVLSVATGLLFGSDVSIFRQCEDAPSQTVGRWTSR